MSTNTPKPIKMMSPVFMLHSQSEFARSAHHRENAFAKDLLSGHLGLFGTGDFLLSDPAPFSVPTGFLFCHVEKGPPFGSPSWVKRFESLVQNLRAKGRLLLAPELPPVPVRQFLQRVLLSAQWVPRLLREPQGPFPFAP